MLKDDNLVGHFVARFIVCVYGCEQLGNEQLIVLFGRWRTVPQRALLKCIQVFNKRCPHIFVRPVKNGTKPSCTIDKLLFYQIF